MYNWQFKEWTHFTYNPLLVGKAALAFAEKQREMNVVLKGLTTAEKQEEIIRFIISEAAKTSEIEGEYISRMDLMSSIKNKLGINQKQIVVKDKRAGAISNMLIAVRNSYNETLTESEIKQWHALLFENSKSIRAGKWRKGEEPMQVISGAMGKEIVHYEAPPSYRVPAEMKQFVKWYNSFKIENKPLDALIKTAISHLYFESIHPFEDGNGRIGRAIAEKCLSQSFGKPVLLSLSTTIEKNKKHYYDALKNAQNTLEITDWIIYFTHVIAQAQEEAVKTVRFSLAKAKFFDKFLNLLNERQLKVINKMLDMGAEDFAGGMTAKKYMSITKTTKATATRDLQELAQNNILQKHGDGRSTHYNLSLK
ncbi:MAG: Fic family protein [Bacteroidetes bacterium]|nr:Fic family protein [Bacteroidota bacterium]